MLSCPSSIIQSRSMPIPMPTLLAGLEPLVEAMAAGLPVIASDVPACREVLDDGDAGALVPAGDVQAWAERLQWLMREPAQRQRLAVAARQRSEAYGMKACARRWYRELLP